MSLDATVYCDCFERARLRSKPPGDVAIMTQKDGSLCRVNESDSLEEALAFDDWLSVSACDHFNGVLLHHRLGNIVQVAIIREELSYQAEQFPQILTKVIYNGMHGGDFIPVEDLPALQVEVDRLKTFTCRKKRSKAFVAEFTEQMRALVEAAREIGKPISF